MDKIDLTQLEAGKEAKITEIIGGQHMLSKVDALGIRVGAKLKKLSSQAWRGPITIQMGNARIAIGFGMAKKIFVHANQP
jgi:ferrous iron transport protein A